MKRKIRDTDIVYSCVAQNGLGEQIVRFAMRPVLHSRPSPRNKKEQHQRRIGCRVVFTHLPYLIATSCISSTATPLDLDRCLAIWNDSTDDRWLDWLAEGEGR